MEVVQKSAREGRSRGLRSSLRCGTCASASGEGHMVPDVGVESVDRDQAGGRLAVLVRIA
jgi:hypothetical protein